ncbi:MAG: DUF3540 domain-containing protein [Saccharospirillaceae bacterium]|nr:DUF3540 domain-containing protein [Saccharospirillaceae bacterium]
MSIESAKIISIVQTPVEQSINKATIEYANSDGVALEINGKQVFAKVSFSCLVKPEIDDIALVAGDACSGYYILSILERPDSDNMVLNFNGDTVLQSLQGSIKVCAKNDISLFSKNINSISKQAIHKSDEAFINFDSLHATGEDANVTYGKIKIIAKALTTFARHALNKFKTYTRHTNDSDQIKAGQMSIDVKGMYNLGTQYSFMVSKKDTKIDGERIHMG